MTNKKYYSQNGACGFEVYSSVFSGSGWIAHPNPNSPTTKPSFMADEAVVGWY